MNIDWGKLWFATLPIQLVGLMVGIALVKIAYDDARQAFHNWLESMTLERGGMSR